MTRPDLDVLESLLAKATPGPYYWFMRECADKDALIAELTEVVDKTDAIDGYNLHGVAVGEPDPDADYLVVAHTGCGPRSPANAQLIVAAVNALPALIARVRELKQEQATLRAALAIAQENRRAAALAMRERCAAECTRIAHARDTLELSGPRVAGDCAATIRALEP